MRRALLLAAAVVAATALAACTPGSSGTVGPTGSVGPSGTSPAPTVSGTDPGEHTTLFGTSVPRGDGSFADALARQDAAYGPLQVARIFYPGAPPPWPGSPADQAARPVVVSFKLPPAEVVAGEHDDALRAWFAQTPTDRDIWWVYFHEPENDIEHGAFSAADFRAAYAHVRALSKEVDRPNLHAALVLQCRTASGADGRVLSDYDPGAENYDVIGFDCYNRQVSQGVYPDVAPWLAPVVAAGASVGRPWALAELGTQLVAGDDGSGRAQWLEQVAAYARAQQAPFVAYFDSAVTGTEYRLSDEPSRSAWRQVVAGES